MSTNKFKYWNLEIDGPDKVGKSLLAQYLTQLSNYRFATHARGYMTQVVYSKKFDRHYEYSMPDKNTVFILLTCNEEEHNIRCNVTNEPKIDFKSDMHKFKTVFDKLQKEGYKCLTYDTSYYSFYTIAKSIIAYIDSWERGE